MKSILISTFLLIIVLFLVMENKEKKAVLIIIFMLAFFGSPFENRFIQTGIRIDMSGIIIFFFWVLIRLKNMNSKKYKNNWKKLSPKVTYLYFFLLEGVFLGLIYHQDERETLLRMLIQTPFQQIINNSINIILVIIFLKILVNFQYDDLLRSKMAKIFMITIFINVFSQMLKLLGMENILMGLFRTQGIFDTEEVRNNGLWAGFGMGVYVVLIISFSSLYYKNHKFLSIAAILSAVVFSILTAARQTIVFTGIFFILIILIYVLKRKLSIKYISMIIIIIIGFVISFNRYLSQTTLFQRFTPGIEYLDQGDVLMASGRDANGIPDVLADISTYPFLGKGLLNLYDTKHSRTNIAGHVIWFNIYKKFGIIGVVYLLTILIYPIVKLYKICIKTKDKYVLKEGAILFSLMVIVFAQQFWDNFFWFSNTMLLYAFIYFWVFSFFNRQKLLNKKQKVI